MIDLEISNIIKKEEERQKNGLEMIASENYVSSDIMQAQGSILTNKYAEGYPQKRYYGGCEYVDQAEQLAINRAQKLFQSEYVNVQPHSGSSANMAAYFSVLNVGDKVLGMELSHGGHLTHGSPVNFSGKLFQFLSYRVSNTGYIDYDQLKDIAIKNRPHLIVAGYSAYSRKLDFKIFREIANAVGAFLMVDMAHFAGLVATKHHESPFPHADIVTSTTHKTLRGPRGGIILAKKEYEKKINAQIFPGFQGGPLEHVIAAKAICFKEASQENFKTYVGQVIKNAQTLANEFLARGLFLTTKGTDNHLVLIDLSQSDLTKNLTGKEAEAILGEAHITVNKNTVPNEKKSPFVTSGLRIGTPALTTRGMKQDEMKTIAHWICDILYDPKNNTLKKKIKNQVQDLCKNFELFKANIH